MQPADSTQRRLDPVGTFTRLREAYFRYYDTPFGLADSRLEAERRALLDRDGGVYRLPLLELRPEYLTAPHSLGQSAAAVGAPEELPAFAEAGLMPPGRRLYAHQESALAAALSPDRHMVITAGTGSGKTESFMLPILASLLRESRHWAGQPATIPATPWWASDTAAFQPQRSGETGREQAVRAMILYPMNALVDDQLTRMRKALDSDDARRWLDTHRNGHRFYFGRFTGATPVTGSSGNPLALRDLIRYLRATQRRSDRARQLSRQSGREDTQYFVPRLDGAEMRSRWDMIDAPPDILITNYSMLNVMLLRERDGHFFNSTRAWLDAHEENRFTLVVDELHMYRGTAGTEVAYLIRALKHRLGLTDRPGKLRVLAASASLDPARDARYLEDFFGVDPNSFDFVEGRTTMPGSARAGSSADAERLAALDPVSAADHARARGLVDTLRTSFIAEAATDTTQAKPAAEIASLLFPHSPQATALDATTRLLTGLAADPQPGDPRLRTHLFFRNVPGVWACTDPRCKAVPGGSYDTRTVGRIYVEPTTRCACGARVLELLYCQTCGDVLLGGFTPEGATQRPRLDTTMLADIPELSKLPDQVKLGRSATNYIVYWPNTTPRLTELSHPDWGRDNNKVRYIFRRSILDPRAGSVSNAASGGSHTGWTFHVTASRLADGTFARDPASLSPYPTVCPACGDDWEIQFAPHRLPHTDPRTQRSPIRGMRTGFEKINQVLITELATDLGARDRRTIVFTDSRQDAAKLASGLGLRHYQDLLRMLLYAELERRGDPASDVDLARAHVVDGTRTEESWGAIGRLQQRDRASYDALRDIWEGAPGTNRADEVSLTARLSRAPTLTELSTTLATELLTLGINPGGPRASLQRAGARHDAPRWTSLYNWDLTPPAARADLSPDQNRLLSEIHYSLLREMLDGLFSGAGRDFESLGLGWMTTVDDTAQADIEPDSATGRARAAIRILADKRRFNGLRDGRDIPPPPLRRLWEAVEHAGGPTVDELRDAFLASVGGAVRDYVIDPSLVVLRRGSGQAWTCPACHRQHLTRGCGRCTRCARPLPAEPGSVAASTEDYYAWKASTGDGRFRLNTAELTGQTDRLDAQSRQARFQDVFLDAGVEPEQPLADGLDLLSVTTTMEAGVDIGALSAVVLANMPPTRFNYQQRIGRAGRRDTPVAVALTVCRGRSHDEYYFDRPASITNDPTPKPYLALGRHEIYLRSARSEVLRLAMREIFPALATQGTPLETTANVHGAFGRIADWNAIRPELAAWLDQNPDQVEAAARALADHTPHTDAPLLAELSASEILRTIDTAIRGSGHGELSQRLAERGVLPMFGFPSSVRYLHLRRPTSAYPWPPAATIDRDLAIAVAQFAPLSEVVRDGQVHTVVGVTAFEPVRPTPRPDPDPLGPERSVSICRSCSYLAEEVARPSVTGATETCPQCGAGSEAFRTVLLREPLGFRAASPRDFDGNFAWSPRAMAARALTDLNTLTAVPTGDAMAYSGPGMRFIVNDNAGQLFRFRPVAPGGRDWGGYVSSAAIEKELLPASAASGDEVSVALGSVQPTDFLFLGPRTATMPTAGLRLNLSGARQSSGARESTDGRRGAWYSLAFLIRTASAAFLDVQPLELTAGIYSGTTGREPIPYAFIADTLENGAGFSTHLGSEAILPQLLDRVETYLHRLGEHDHSGECDSSCYRCLRDYGNMAYHALLDWRLARDLFGLLRGRSLAVDASSERRSLSQWAAAYDATMLEDIPAARFAHPQHGVVLVLARHPLEASERALISPRIAHAAEQAQRMVPEAGGVVFVDTFTLDRDPRRVIEMCDEAEARSWC